MGEMFMYRSFDFWREISDVFAVNPAELKSASPTGVDKGWYMDVLGTIAGNESGRMRITEGCLNALLKVHIISEDEFARVTVGGEEEIWIFWWGNHSEVYEDWMELPKF